MGTILSPYFAARDALAARIAELDSAVFEAGARTRLLFSPT
jgi:hypothetical protein